MALKKVMAPVVSEDTEEIGGKVFSEKKKKKGLFCMSLRVKNSVLVRGGRTKAEFVLFWQTSF